MDQLSSEYFHMLNLKAICFGWAQMMKFRMGEIVGIPIESLS